jgi:hypothetical protein
MTITNNAALRALRFPAMTSGSIGIENSPLLETLDVPALRNASVGLNNTGFRTLDLGHVEEMGSIGVLNNARLTSLVLGGTTSNNVEIASNPALLTASFPRLATPQLVVVDRNAAITTVSMPLLSEVRGWLKFQRNPRLSAVSVPRLQKIASSLIVADTEMTSLDWLAGMRGTIRYLYVVNNKRLTDVGGLANLGSAGAPNPIIELVEFGGNTALAESDVRSVLTTIDARAPGNAFQVIVINGVIIGPVP